MTDQIERAARDVAQRVMGLVYERGRSNQGMPTHQPGWYTPRSRPDYLGTPRFERAEVFLRTGNGMLELMEALLKLNRMSCIRVMSDTCQAVIDPGCISAYADTAPDALILAAAQLEQS